MHTRIGAQALLVGAIIYSIGWGPALAVGFVLVGQEGLAVVGPSAQRAVLGWNFFALALGQLLIALGIMPTLIPTPEVHGLAMLAALGIAFSYRSLGSALVEKEQAAAVTQQHERRFRALVQSSQDLVFVFDASAFVTYASPSCEQVLGYEPAMLIGPDSGKIIHEDDKETLRASVQRAVAVPSGRASLQMRVQHRDGAWVWIEGVATNLLDDPAVAGVVINARDVTGRVSAEQALRHQALHDPLTGLANRTLFNDRLEHAITRSKRHGGYVAVMIVDLDGFKTVNDSLGHQVGDDLLIAVAERFRNALRAYETVARLGGDEFAILLEDLHAPEHGGLVAQRVLDSLATPIDLGDREVAIGASIGIAIAERDAPNPERLLSHADTAMYRAKREGKGCYRGFEQSMHAAAVERLELEQALRVAIAEDALTVDYQPIVDMRTGVITGFEALARWCDPNKGAIRPDVFIPIAEETNLILDLGRAVLARACAQTASWRCRFPERHLNIAINISPHQLAHPSFLNDVQTTLTETGLQPTDLVVELTESALADQSGRVINTLDQLRRTGIRVAIDDFGTGYSSFAALAELPIDILKIDKRFIDNVAVNHRGRGFVNAIIQLAQTLGLETVAEGVEREEQRQALVELGSTHFQGYLYAKPLTTEAAQEHLQTSLRESR
jgi:diguanylate cyclase (GGDEF)-like protein/PAS domain S-box-containing protein